MPEWENCIKIHEKCGGLVKWVEAIDTIGVGYHGKCRKCDSRLVQEEIIPIEMDRDISTPTEILEDLGHEKLASLHWKNQDSWEENQERLKKEVSVYG